MGNLASICINPDEEKPSNTLYAGVSKNAVGLNVDESEERQEITEIPLVESKQIEIADQDQEVEKPKETEGVLFNNDEGTHNENFEVKLPSITGKDSLRESPQDDEKNDFIYNQYGSIPKQENLRELVSEEVNQLFKDEVKSLEEVKVLEEVEVPVNIEETTTKNGFFDFNALKQVHASVETASVNDIRNATAAGVLEAEQDLAEPINYNGYTVGNIKENHELPPCYIGETGEFYNGHWNDEGKQEGKGYMVRKDGSKLEGVWSDGELVWGRIYNTDGSFYTGKVSDSLPNGKGVFVTKDRKILKGTFTNGQLNQGEIQYETTNYKGQVRNGVPNGQGEYKDTHYTYLGEWENGKRVNGKLTYADGTVFEGVFSDNLPTAGKFLWKNGTVYEGDLKNLGGLHHGTLIHSSGSYEGQWNGNYFHGKGTYIWKNSNSNRYEGEYKQGKKEGKGTYYVNTEDFFRGNFRTGKPDGEGDFVRNGRVIKGRWRKGTFVNILGDSQPGDEEALNFDVVDEVNNVATLPHLTKP